MSRRPGLSRRMAAALERAGTLSLHAGPRNLLPIPAQRRLLEDERRWWNEVPPPLPREWRFDLQGPERIVPVHGFEPAGARPGDPWIVWFHGGGWVLGSAATHASLIRGVAIETGMRVFAPDYALAPEHPFPAPVQEARAILEQLLAGAAGPELDRRRMVVGGDSSGANVALAAALELEREWPGAVRAGAFYYGVFDDRLDDEASRAFGDGAFGLSVDRMRYYWDCYVPAVDARADPRVNLQHADLSRAFPMYLMAAECDILCDGARRFGSRLRDHGIPHRLRVCEGMGHAFMGYGRMLPEVTGVHRDLKLFLQAMADRPD